MIAAWARRLGEQSGQTATEYLGLIVVIAAILAAIAQAGIDVQIRDGVERQVCKVLGNDRETCDEQASAKPGPDGGQGSGDGSTPGAPNDGGTETVGLDSIETGGLDQGQPAPTEPAPEDNPACEEGYAPTDSDGEDEVGQDILNGPTIRCEDGVPVLDLNRDGVDDNDQRDLFCAQADACPDDTDFNDNGIPDRLEPGEFDHLTPPIKCGGGEGITDPFFVDQFCTTENRYYRPGQPGVECEEIDDSELSDDEKDAIECKPIPDLLDELERSQAKNDPRPNSLCEVQIDNPLLCTGLGFLTPGGAPSRADDAPGFLRRLLDRIRRGTQGRSREPGSYVRKNESMSDFSRRYQEQQGGRPGQAYRVTGPDGKPVDFDAIDGDTLIDGKAKLAQFFDEAGNPKPFFRGAEEAVDQARRQVRAAEGRPIEWRFAEPGPARYFADRFEVEGIPIIVRHVPLR